MSKGILSSSLIQHRKSHKETLGELRLEKPTKISRRVYRITQEYQTNQPAQLHELYNRAASHLR